MSTKTLCSAVLLFSLIAIPQALAKTVERRFDSSPGGTLEVDTQVGSITVESHDSNEILVEIEIDGDREDEFSLDFDHDGADLRIFGQREGENWWGSNRVRVHFLITVPKEFDVELQTAGGRIETADLTGDVDARTSGGSIQVGNVKGDVELKTSGGSIRTDDIYGEIDAHTSGGSINVTFARQPEEDAKLETSGGSITARFPADVAIDLDASTSGGRVSSDFDVNGRIKKRSIEGEINGGGPRVRLHTSGGSVRVEKI